MNSVFKFPVKLIETKLVNKLWTYPMVSWIVAEVIGDWKRNGKTLEDVILKVNRSKLIATNEHRQLFACDLHLVCDFEQRFEDDNVFMFATREESGCKVTLYICTTINTEIVDCLIDCLKRFKAIYSVIHEMELMSKQYEVKLVEVTEEPDDMSINLIDKTIAKHREKFANANMVEKSLVDLLSPSERVRRRSRSLSTIQALDIDPSILTESRALENKLDARCDSEISLVSIESGEITDDSVASEKCTSKRDGFSDSGLNLSTNEVNDEPNDETVSNDCFKVKDRSQTVSEANFYRHSGMVHKDNMTLLFLIGRNEVQFISPDRKEVLLKKSLDLIVKCLQGNKYRDHFGLICRKLSTENVSQICYVFKCKNMNSVKEIMEVLEKTFQSAHQSFFSEKKNNIMCCPQCPMLLFHSVCKRVNVLKTAKEKNRKIKDSCEKFVQSYTELIINKVVTFRSVQEENEFLMAQLRRLAEKMQLVHDEHIHDTEEKKVMRMSFSKLSASLENIFKPFKTVSSVENGYGRSRSSTMDNSINRPFLGSMKTFTCLVNSKLNGNYIRHRSSSMSVTNNTCDSHVSKNYVIVEQCDEQKRSDDSKKKLSFKCLWKKVVKEHIETLRILKENKQLLSSLTLDASNIKLNYIDYYECEENCEEMWRSIFANSDCNYNDIVNAVRIGVPKQCRGKIWFLLTQRQKMESKSQCDCTFNLDIPFAKLLTKLAPNQHEIIIDLNRTFPNNDYFSLPFGIGQLSLFNVLKAYSLLDKELGYCQGTGFIAGILLIHADEETSFDLLKHLFIFIGLRKQYIPGMSLMKQLKESFSELLKVECPDIYYHFERHGVTLDMYATNWFLTLFASQFPIPFVSRFFDMLFVFGIEAIQRLSLCVLTYFKEDLLKLHSLDSIANFLKVRPASLTEREGRIIFDHFFTLKLTSNIVLDSNCGCNDINADS
ncbi:uncharacterized protein B4U80_10307 [Leptotrombidium deliense]|uniref:Rab-GAP TBC domain-containing protein n=1 Tax=Leptotrombidium deliense TaxID=299467 RepID=A0A443SPJ9_9ACAR|nr:uncharacterized protein B4U80_10307 [Leptotrombidium deliense]